MAGVPILPVWARGLPITGASYDAYQYLLQQFNEKHDRHDSGLVFGYTSFPEVSALYERIDEVGAPSGAMFPPETHLLLELEIPDDTPMLTVDFYRFSDLLFCYADGGDEELTLDVAKSDLLLANGSDGFELPVAHIPYVLPEWVIAQHEPKNI